MPNTEQLTIPGVRAGAGPPGRLRTAAPILRDRDRPEPYGRVFDPFDPVEPARASLVRPARRRGPGRLPERQHPPQGRAPVASRAPPHGLGPLPVGCGRGTERLRDPRRAGQDGRPPRGPGRPSEVRRRAGDRRGLALPPPAGVARRRFDPGRHHLALRHRRSRGGRPGSRAPRRIPDRLRPGADRLFRVVPAGRGGTPGVSHRADRGARLGSARPSPRSGRERRPEPPPLPRPVLPGQPRPGETDGVLSASTDPRPFARSSSSCGLSRPSPSTSRTSAARRASPSARFASSSSSSSARAPSGSSGRAASASFSTRSARPASG